MSDRNLAILAIVAGVMVILAIALATFSNRPPAAPSGPTYLIQGLDPDDIGSIVVGTGDDAVTIRRTEQGFVLTSKNNYPADTKQINDLITKCLEIRYAELYTTDAKNHKDLGITEEDARYVIRFLAADGNDMTGVLVGKSQETGQGTYVRRAGEDKVYVAESTPWFRDRAVDYLNQELVSVKSDEIVSVAVTAPGEAYSLKATEGSDGVELVDLPGDKKLKAGDAKSVLTALTSLRFDDVNTPADVTTSFDRSYVCSLNNTTVYTLKLAKADDKAFLTCQAQYTDPNKISIDPKGKDTPEELKAKEAKLLAQENVLKFNQRHKNWIYQIPDWKANYLTKSLADLLEDKEPEEPEETAGDSPMPDPLAEAVTIGPLDPNQAAVDPNAAQPTPEPAP